jgi:arylsulfatase A-like enzyme
MAGWSRPTCRTWVIGCLAAWGFAGSGLAIAADPPPNVVFILSDDQHWRDYAFMGHPHLRTPHLDRLARESLVFPRGYVTSSLCSPSLASIITGRYPHEHRIVGNDPPGGKEAFAAGRERMTRHLEEWPTLPRLLGARGYQSLQTGKWWQGDFSRGGFTEGMTKGARHGDEGLAIGRKTMQPIYDFIGRSRAAGKPFFVWYAPMLPHDPHDPAQELVEHYATQTGSVHVARYWGNVERFDRTVGDLLDHLDREQLSANTLVVYVTDNGWIQSPDSPRFAPRSKLSPSDGGLRSPIMLRQPGTIQPRTSDALASAIDIVPTVLAACGVEPPAGLPGVNLLDDKPVSARRQVFGECYTHTLVDLDDPAKSLLWRWTVRDRWKLIVPTTAGAGGALPAEEAKRIDSDSRGRYERGEIELFDVVADPDEATNVAAVHPDVVAELRARLDAWWNPAKQTTGAPANAARPTGGNRPPNFVVFLADDLGAHDLGCTGSTFHRSPAIDRLASEGLLFTRGYAAAPVCSPTRAALVTGRHPARVKITNFIAGDRRGSLLPADYVHALPASEVTVAERLCDAGYATGVFGKWHLGPPADIPAHGFEVTGSTTVGPGSGPSDDPMHARAIAAQAAAFIESNRDRPFFCYVPMHSVHVPLITRPELAAENTLVVFTSDNGGLSTAEGAPTSNLPLRAGKGFVYEGGIRVPLIVRWPAVVRPGTTSDVPITTLDIAATLVDVAGTPARDDAPLDGSSLRPLLSGSGTVGPRDLFWHYPHYSNQGGRPAAALVSGNEKIVEHFEDGKVELFDLTSDPGERRNLAGERSERAGELAARLAAWRRQVGAALPTPNPQPVDPFAPATVPRRKAG